MVCGKGARAIIGLHWLTLVDGQSWTIKRLECVAGFLSLLSKCQLTSIKLIHYGYSILCHRTSKGLCFCVQTKMFLNPQIEGLLGVAYSELWPRLDFLKKLAIIDNPYCWGSAEGSMTNCGGQNH